MAETQKGWMARAKAVAKDILVGVEEVEGIRDLDTGYGGYDSVTVSTMLGTGNKQARSRIQILSKYHFMAGDPIISTALRLHVTMALGGHEATGDTVFFEPKPGIDKAQQKLAEELAADLLPIFNRIAHPVSFNGAAFGDAYGRIYTKEGIGIVDVYVDELVSPMLVQPFERGNNTVGYQISVGEKFTEKLTIKQMARLKMPRGLYVPQVRVIEKALRVAITQDDISALPIMPALVGGSFLDAAEESFNNLNSALQGLVGQRLLNSIDENILTANMQDMTLEQRKEFKESLVKMLTASKKRIDDSVRTNTPVTNRFFHILPTFGDKQVAQISSISASATGGGAGQYTTEDVLFHAKLLAGSLGIDLAMLGFSELLSGGLGDGGFFRVSAQAAERSRIIRTALTEFYHNLVDMHTLAKFGWVFDPRDRPYSINFFGSISALENEKAASHERAVNASAVVIQTMAQLRDIGFDEKTNATILSKMMQMDEDLAKELAKGLANAKPPAPEGGDGGFGGGGGGFGGGKQPPEDFDDPQAGTADDGE